jgi:uncharacterized protein YndB with AHSA1/START domain
MTATLSSTFTLTLVGDREIHVTRMLNAPRELVFRAMTSCEHIKHWLGPRSLTMTSCEMDCRPGGSYRYTHRDPNGAEYAFRGEIREVTPPERVVQTFEFEMMPGHISLETLTLEDLNGQTKVTIRSLFQTPEDRDGMAASGMEGGMRDSYDRLEEYLPTLA